MKLTGPMMSLDASGSIGGVLVAAKWKGRNYMRTLVTPSNPRSAGQTATRAMMKFLSQQWALLDPSDQATYEGLASSNAYSPFNAYVSANMARWTQWDAPAMAYPANGAGIGATFTALTAVGGVRQATVTIDPNVNTDAWGYILYSEFDNSGFAPAKTNVVGVVPADGNNNVTFVHTPIAPGTWFYRVGSFSVGGAKSAIFATEASATVT